MRTCVVCDSKPATCQCRCKTRAFCSRQCQVEDWKELGHKGRCPRKRKVCPEKGSTPRSLLKAGEPLSKLVNTQYVPVNTGMPVIATATADILYNPHRQVGDKNTSDAYDSTCKACVGSGSDGLLVDIHKTSPYTKSADRAMGKGDRVVVVDSVICTDPYCQIPCKECTQACTDVACQMKQLQQPQQPGQQYQQQPNTKQVGRHNYNRGGVEKVNVRVVGNVLLHDSEFAVPASVFPPLKTGNATTTLNVSTDTNTAIYTPHELSCVPTGLGTDSTKRNPDTLSLTHNVSVKKFRRSPLDAIQRHVGFAQNMICETNHREGPKFTELNTGTSTGTLSSVSPTTSNTGESNPESKESTCSPGPEWSDGGSGGGQPIKLQGSGQHACHWTGCGWRFHNKSGLERHQRIHTKEKPYSCPKEGCDKKFSQRHHVKAHCASVHDEVKAWRCSMDTCGKSFSRKESLTRHERTHK
ncbi:hypothetical protein SARC_02646 [Sphaeroforma arctica JP610]|uniref:Zinc finger protein n=1 Tax=Sphaeroforma arctica JP610 TaxID=667725 RepID=A0A0L0GA86_9EUKA|nr:hypothetical protein SARC_02646 [Sphaeroforma arctica JP610]KNC85153.1 hypothetical protein SARC_02646 [Sphaeroforma arctica JP610]|eukprot:XP_014159055.1 hypothetical protein SARC_02646 [Sphaeroforma arctica JP610]